jgi:hypothetical protein
MNPDILYHEAWLLSFLTRVSTNNVTTVTSEVVHSLADELGFDVSNHSMDFPDIDTMLTACILRFVPRMQTEECSIYIEEPCGFA